MIGFEMRFLMIAIVSYTERLGAEKSLTFVIAMRMIYMSLRGADLPTDPPSSDVLTHASRISGEAETLVRSLL